MLLVAAIDVFTGSRVLIGLVETNKRVGGGKVFEINWDETCSVVALT